jgi:hypothetical protein
MGLPVNEGTFSLYFYQHRSSKNQITGSLSASHIVVIVIKAIGHAAVIKMYPPHVAKIFS